MTEPVEYEKVISDNEDKNFQIRLVVNEFRDAYYLHIRKYFLSYEGEYIPSSEGISMALDMESVKRLFEGIAEICAAADAVNIIEDVLKRHNE